MAEVILVTGAAGRIGSELRQRLARPGRTLRLLDVAPMGNADENEELVSGSITDPACTEAACAGVDAVVHLGGISNEAPFEEIVAVNIHGTKALLDAARANQVPRVVLASSNHAVGFQPKRNLPIPADVPFAPDTWYGWSKTAMESMGRLYHDRFGIDVVVLRIGSCFPQPSSVRTLATWLSYADCARLVEAALTTPSPGFRQVWGVSANTRRWWSLAEGEAIGYHPQDDGEAYASQVPDTGDYDEIGGRHTVWPLGEYITGF